MPVQVGPEALDSLEPTTIIGRNKLFNTDMLSLSIQHHFVSIALILQIKIIIDENSIVMNFLSCKFKATKSLFRVGNFFHIYLLI